MEGQGLEFPQAQCSLHFLAWCLNSGDRKIQIVAIYIEDIFGLSVYLAETGIADKEC